MPGSNTDRVAIDCESSFFYFFFIVPEQLCFYCDLFPESLFSSVPERPFAGRMASPVFSSINTIFPRFSGPWHRGAEAYGGVSGS